MKKAIRIINRYKIIVLILSIAPLVYISDDCMKMFWLVVGLIVIIAHYIIKYKLRNK